MSLVICQFFCENHKKNFITKRDEKRLQNFTGGDIKKGNENYQEIKLKSIVKVSNIKLVQLKLVIYLDYLHDMLSNHKRKRAVHTENPLPLNGWGGQSIY